MVLLGLIIEKSPSLKADNIMFRCHTAKVFDRQIFQLYGKAFKCEGLKVLLLDLGGHGKNMKCACDRMSQY